MTHHNQKVLNHLRKIGLCTANKVAIELGLVQDHALSCLEALVRMGEAKAEPIGNAIYYSPVFNSAEPVPESNGDAPVKPEPAADAKPVKKSRGRPPKQAPKHINEDAALQNPKPSAPECQAAKIALKINRVGLFNDGSLILDTADGDLIELDADASKLIASTLREVWRSEK